MRFSLSTICLKLMSYGRKKNQHVQTFFYLLFLLFSFSATQLMAEEFSFDLEEIDKNPFSWGGYAEVKLEHMELRQTSAYSLLNFADEPRSTINRLGGRLQLDGSYIQELYSFSWLLKMAGQEDDFGWHDTVDLFTAYLNIKPVPSATVSLGKKPYKWGKGYAWNPVGFINRRKDPNNPDESLEGYITAEADFIKSFSGKLQTVALTTVLLPVYDEINDDFGVQDELNLAAKLYFLIMDTDIDFLLLVGNSRADKYGMDFSKNLLTNFEIHGELAWINDGQQIRLQEDGTFESSQDDAQSLLLGIRYLSENDITSIVEYYHNNAGYTEEEMEIFYDFAKDAGEEFQQTTSHLLLDRAIDASLKGYGRPQPGRDYLYLRFSQKEPFDILYFTPAVTAIVNLADNSFTLTPELIYTGFTNWEMRLRFSYLGGESYTEYGEKQNSSKLEFRLRYFF
jgi:hypothetical protein